MSWFSTLTPPVQAAVVSAAVSALVTIGVAIGAPLLQRPIERLRAGLSGSIEALKAELADETATRSARTAYEFDARKRLYSEIEPLLFQLFEASENSYRRVVSLVQNHLEERLHSQETSRLRVPNGYYFNSVIHFIFQPLAIYRLIQRSTTFVDLGLDERIRIRYGLLKLSLLAFTDDFVLARREPSLRYEPDVDGQSVGKTGPDIHSRQGLYLGHIDQFIEAIIVQDGQARRPMTFGEFEYNAQNKEAFKLALAPVKDIFVMFDFPARPVLGRILLVHACLMRLLLLTYAQSVGIHELEGALAEFLKSDQAKKELVWWRPADPNRFDPVYAHLVERLRWLSVDHYKLSG
jgi:hypothetical protein